MNASVSAQVPSSDWAAATSVVRSATLACAATTWSVALLPTELGPPISLNGDGRLLHGELCLICASAAEPFSSW